MARKPPACKTAGYARRCPQNPDLLEIPLWSLHNWHTADVGIWTWCSARFFCQSFQILPSFMDCKICEFKQRQFYCDNCLKTQWVVVIITSAYNSWIFGFSIHDFRHQTQHYALDRDEHISKASKALNETMTPSRISRASLSTCQRRVEELQAGLVKLRKENEKSAWCLRFLHVLWRMR